VHQIDQCVYCRVYIEREIRQSACFVYAYVRLCLDVCILAARNEWGSEDVVCILRTNIFQGQFCICVYAYACVYVYVCVQDVDNESVNDMILQSQCHAFVRICLRVCMVCVCMHTCVCVCVCVSMCVCVCCAFYVCNVWVRDQSRVQQIHRYVRTIWACLHMYLCPGVKCVYSIYIYIYIYIHIYIYIIQDGQYAVYNCVCVCIHAGLCVCLCL
jgi:hypothetical protein